MPKDDTHFPAAQPAAPRPGLVPRFLSWLFATGGTQTRHAMHGTHEELFRMRGELAVLRGEIESIHAAVGRRDIATVDELLRGGSRRQVEALIRDRTQTVPLPDGSVLCRVLGRFKMFVDAADGGIAPHLLLDGYWQYWVTEFICRNVARGETAYDIGAFYGYYTVVLADLVRHEGRVVALEGNPWLHALLGRNIRVNGLGGTATARRLVAAEGPHAALTLPAGLAGPRDGPVAAEFTEVNGRQFYAAPALPLDEVEPGSIDFLRIGSPSLAPRVVAGLGGIMDRSPNLRIMIEFDAARILDPEAMLATLAARYPLRFVDGDARAKPTTIEDLMTHRRVTTLYLSRVEAA